MAWSRTTRQSRGYDKVYAARHPLVMKRDGYICQCPECRGGELRLRPAQEVDHIVPLEEFRAGRAKGDPHAMSNLRAVNKECHKRLTMAAQGRTPPRRYDRNGRRVE